jgi:hypothetical protein
VTHRIRWLWPVLAAIAVAIALSGTVDRISAAEATRSLQRALVTFAVARGINGAISVAQGTELAIEPAGVGVVLSIGQILDPINDLIERFSAIMLLAASSIGLQNLLLKITSTAGFDVALGLAALWVLLSAAVPAVRGSAPWAQRTLLAMIFARFAVPLLVIASNLVFTTFLEAEQRAALAALEGVQADIEDLNRERQRRPAPDATLLERFDSLLDDTLASLDVEAALGRLGERVSSASEHVVSLIVIFVLQTVLLPVAFIWLFIELLKSIGLRLAGRR